jgi:hypothetical protein
MPGEMDGGDAVIVNVLFGEERKRVFRLFLFLFCP